MKSYLAIALASVTSAHVDNLMFQFVKHIAKYDLNFDNKDMFEMRFGQFIKSLQT